MAFWIPELETHRSPCHVHGNGMPGNPVCSPSSTPLMTAVRAFTVSTVRSCRWAAQALATFSQATPGNQPHIAAQTPSATRRIRHSARRGPRAWNGMGLGSFVQGSSVSTPNLSPLRGRRQKRFDAPPGFLAVSRRAERHHYTHSREAEFWQRSSAAPSYFLFYLF